ncbi:uncharacterized protein LOC117523000 [Thalassophryne amazonica]|uniref:uncharacterized protein LOC117523000 n=1 Tax=Thalassophryne amazonica TaxID=390379 RepID=UPI0014720068|nr:uncharacterized protein LOC117523000 [Thalassophryne amazonica]
MSSSLSSVLFSSTVTRESSFMLTTEPTHLIRSEGKSQSETWREREVWSGFPSLPSGWTLLFFLVLFRAHSSWWFLVVPEVPTAPVVPGTSCSGLTAIALVTVSSPINSFGIYVLRVGGKESIGDVERERGLERFSQSSQWMDSAVFPGAVSCSFFLVVPEVPTAPVVTGTSCSGLTAIALVTVSSPINSFGIYEQDEMDQGEELVCSNKVIM